MLSNPTRICPSSLLKCSDTGLGHSWKPVQFGRVGFTPRTDLSYRFSHLHEKIFTANQTRNKKATEIDGLAASTCEDEEEGWSEEEQKDMIKVFEDLSEEEKKEMVDHFEIYIKEDVMNLFEFLDGSFIKKSKKFKDSANGLDKEEIRPNFLEGIKKFIMALLDVVLRTGFIKKVFGILLAQLLLGSVGYTAMKMSPAITAALQQNYFYLFSLLFTGGLFLLPTLKAFKDMSSVGEKSILNSIFLGLFNVAIVSIGVVLADIHLASSNGIIMVGALVTTLATFGLTILAILLNLLCGRKDMSDLETTVSSSFTVPAVVIASFIQIVNPGPISAVIDVGCSGFIFCSFLFYDIWASLKRYYKDDDYMKASAHLFLDLYGLFIVSLKVLGMLSGLFLFSSNVLGMLSTLLISSITTFMK